MRRTSYIPRHILFDFHTLTLICFRFSLPGKSCVLDAQRNQSGLAVFPIKVSKGNFVYTFDFLVTVLRS